jgi:hypothetical protein
VEAAICGRMSKSLHTLPKAPSEETLRQLADLLVVPPEQHEFFFESVRSNVQTACELNGLAKRGLAGKRGKKLMGAALTLYDTVGNLSKGERALMEEIFNKANFIFDKISSGGVPGLEQTAHQLALLASLVTGKAPPRYPSQLPESPGRGRRVGTTKHPVFQQFVWDLLISIKVADGKFSFEKLTPRGTLVQAINKLTRSLPDKFVPKPFPGSTVQRLIDLSGRFAKAVDKFE